jgi:hypothetical protein
MMSGAMDNMIGDICVPNISTAERRKRLAGGIFSLAIGLAGLAGLVVLDLNLWWRLALFPVFVAAASGYFQWREKT